MKIKIGIDLQIPWPKIFYKRKIGRKEEKEVGEIPCERTNWRGMASEIWWPEAHGVACEPLPNANVWRPEHPALQKVSPDHVRYQRLLPFRVLQADDPSDVPCRLLWFCSFLLPLHGDWWQMNEGVGHRETEVIVFDVGFAVGKGYIWSDWNSCCDDGLQILWDDRSWRGLAGTRTWSVTCGKEWPERDVTWYWTPDMHVIGAWQKPAILPHDAQSLDSNCLPPHKLIKLINWSLCHTRFNQLSILITIHQDGFNLYLFW